jgi:phage FluMu protein Com
MASLSTKCPHCQYAIPPNETQRVSFTEMKCPKCERTFDP